MVSRALAPHFPMQLWLGVNINAITMQARDPKGRALNSSIGDVFFRTNTISSLDLRVLP
jgi:hypothetical protein